MCTRLYAAAFLALAGLAETVRSAEPRDGAPSAANSDETASDEVTRAAATRGLEFLVKDAAAWREQRKCATCHHGVMTTWALSEAKARGYAVSPETFDQTVTWAKERLKDVDKPRDTRPGWNMVSTPAVYLAVMAQAVPGQGAISDDELTRIAGHLVRHQEEDGSWAWSLAPPQNRYPPVFESDEIVTWLASAALRPHAAGNGDEASAARASRERAAAWLAKTLTTGTTQAAAVRLLAKVLEAAPAEERRPESERLLALQTEDGGWGQTEESPSDAYATGQALYVLTLAGVGRGRPEIRRAAAFLVRTQREDGSWAMSPRAQPGAKPAGNVVPITYFGSAWGTMGLMRAAGE